MHPLKTALTIATLALCAGARNQEVDPAGRPGRFLELALSNKSANLGFRALTQEGLGFMGVSLLANDDDDFALAGKLVRQGEFEGIPVRLGVGIGAHAVFVDRPDANVYALSLAALTEYDLPTRIPSTVSWNLSYAPNITTFDDGESLLDTELRVRMDLTDAATAFIGYRLLRVDVGRDVDVDARVHVGIRLAF